jgi:glycosyltransferase involved in cell wall biosynthesis
VKVLFDFQIFQIQRYGGISKYFYHLLKGLSNFEDLDIFLFQGLHQNKYPWSEIDGKFSQRFGVFFNSPESMHRLVSLANQFAFLAYKELRLRPNITHLTYYPFVLPARGRSKLVVTLHDLIPERYPEYYAGNPILERRKKALDEADLIICVSEATRRDYLELLNGDMKKTTVIYHGLSFSGDNDPSEARASVHSGTKPYILYVGKRESYKNFSALLSAYSSSARMVSDFDICCFGSHSFTHDEIQTMTELGISRNLHHADGTENELRAYYSHARALAYPSLCEGFGFPLLEAMQTGCPVAASDCSSLPEVGGDAAVYFAPTDVDSMRSALESVLYDEQVRARCIQNGYDRVRQFSWETTARKTRDAYRNLL